MAAADTNNGLVMAGVAPGAQVLNVPVTQCEKGRVQIVDPSTYRNRVLHSAGLLGHSLDYGDNPNPADILVATIGGPGPCPALVQSAIDVLRDEDKIFVAAVGDNDDLGLFPTLPSWPSNCKNVLRVAGHGRTGLRSTGASTTGRSSNVGVNLVDLSAPAQDIPVSTMTLNASGLLIPSSTTRSGSAYAAAEVGGALADMIALEPDLPRKRVVRRLLLATRYNPSIDRTVLGRGMLSFDRDAASVRARRQESEGNDTPDDADQIDASADVEGWLQQTQRSFSELASLGLEGCINTAGEGYLVQCIEDPNDGPNEYLVNDVDFFKVYLPQAQTLTVSLAADLLPGAVNTCLVAIQPKDDRWQRRSGDCSQTLTYTNNSNRTLEMLIFVRQLSREEGEVPYTLYTRWRP